MNPYIAQIIVSYAVTFILRQLEKFNESTDWAKVKADVEPRVRSLVPGSWFDDEAVAAVSAVVDAVAVAAKNTVGVEEVLSLVAKADWRGAERALRNLMMTAVVADKPDLVACLAGRDEGAAA